MFSFHLENITSVRYRCSPSGLTLNRTQVLRSASKFAPGHRVERLAPFWVPNRTGPRPASPAPSYRPKPEPRGRADETVACGLCPDSQCAVKAAFKFTLLSPQRAEGKRGHGREEAPPAQPTLTPPSPGNRLDRHGLLSLFKTFSSPSTSRGFACFTQF